MLYFKHSFLYAFFRHVLFLADIYRNYFCHQNNLTVTMLPFSRTSVFSSISINPSASANVVIELEPFITGTASLFSNLTAKNSYLPTVETIFLDNFASTVFISGFIPSILWIIGTTRM